MNIPPAGTPIRMTPDTDMMSDHDHDADTVTILHVPSMHCAGCISKIEHGLNTLPDVTTARVNLSRKHVRIKHSPSLKVDHLINVLDDQGFFAHAIDPDHFIPASDKDIKSMLMRLAVAGFGMMNVMLLSISVWSGAAASTERLLNLVAALIAIPVIAYSARPFFSNALMALRAYRLNMDVPISLAIWLAVGNSLYLTLTSGGQTYFDAALALTFFLLGGRYLDVMIRRKALSAASSLAQFKMGEARKINSDGSVIAVPVPDLSGDDIVEIRPGDMIPADGIIVDGISEIDRSVLTGESLPLGVSSGDEVFSGDANISGLIRMKVTAGAGDTVLDALIQLTEQAEQNRNRYTALADRAAALYAPLVHITAFLAFGFWLVMGAELQFAINTAIAVLIITCPCALGLAVPAVVSVANSRLFSHGILIKDGTALEKLAKVDTILFDKTGTLTTGAFQSHDLPDLTPDEKAALYELAQASHHPYAQAIATAMRDVDLPLVDIQNIKETQGCGISGYISKRDSNILVQLGSSRWLDNGYDHVDNNGGLVFRYGQKHRYFLPVMEQIRPALADMMKHLDQAGYHLVMLTGDHAGMAGRIAKALGFKTWMADVSAADKLKYIETLKSDGAAVVMIGDGINDMGAMACADLAISPASARHATRMAAQVVVLGDRLDKLPSLLRMAKLARRRIIQNFLLAAIYNLIAIPIAFAGFATPLLAAVMMSTSSITVTCNALRLPVYKTSLQISRGTDAS